MIRVEGEELGQVQDELPVREQTLVCPVAARDDRLGHVITHLTESVGRGAPHPPLSFAIQRRNLTQIDSCAAPSRAAFRAVNGRMRPISRLVGEAVLHRVVMYVIKGAIQVVLIADAVFPEAALPDASLAAANARWGTNAICRVPTPGASPCGITVGRGHPTAQTDFFTGPLVRLYQGPCGRATVWPPSVMAVPRSGIPSRSRDRGQRPRPHICTFHSFRHPPPLVDATRPRVASPATPGRVASTENGPSNRKENAPRDMRGAFQLLPAAIYSPTRSPGQYHRR